MAKRKSSENSAESSASFEESLLELQSIVAELEDGTLGLETSLARFERGIGLLRACYSILETAEAKVEILTRFQGNGTAVTAPFENSASFDVMRDQAGFTSTGSQDIATADEIDPADNSTKSSLF